jgi:hypothetical protein
MKLSPVQMLKASFKHVRVETDEARVPAELPNPLTTVFVFSGIDVRTDFGMVEADGPNDEGRTFFGTLRVVVDNQPRADEPARNFSPYLIDVQVDGVFLVPRGAEKLAPPEDLVAVNGAGMLWSVIREQVFALTSRMPVGPVMLPTVHFHDLKKSSLERQPVEPPSAGAGGEEGAVVPASPAKPAAKKKPKR